MAVQKRFRIEKVKNLKVKKGSSVRVSDISNVKKAMENQGNEQTNSVDAVDKNWTLVKELLVKGEWLNIKLEIMDQEKSVSDHLNSGLLKVIDKVINCEGNARIIHKFKIELTRDDLIRLNWKNGAWLNDNIINFFMEMINERSRNNHSLLQVYAFNTYFAKKLSGSEYKYETVQRWTKKIKLDLFSLQKVFIPVHQTNHWALVTIHMDDKVIEHYDSLGRRNTDLLYQVQSFILDEHMNRHGEPLNEEGWRFKIADGPYQENSSDCGVFMCGYIDLTAMGYLIFMNQEHMTLFRKKMMFELGSGEMYLTQTFGEMVKNQYRPVHQTKGNEENGR